MRRVWLFLASRFRFFPTPEELKADNQQRLQAYVGRMSDAEWDAWLCGAPAVDDVEFERIVARLACRSECCANLQRGNR